MHIGIDIDNVLSNFNDVLLNEYKKHDNAINGKGIVHQDLYIRDMFNWDKEYEKIFTKKILSILQAYLNRLKNVLNM